MPFIKVAIAQIKSYCTPLLEQQLQISLYLWQRSGTP
jgi:hypothetical protein